MLDVVQGTTEWLQARCGLVTASRVADVVARTKSGYSASRATYMGELIAERLTGVPAQGFTNAAMAWGTATEPQAREAYRTQTFDDVVEVGFVLHPRIAMSGASPDGLVGADGLLELKCPQTATHIDTLLGGKVPAKYETQMLWQMACTGRQWCDFCSFDPRLPEPMRLFVKRLERDDKRIAELEEMVAEFIAELDDKVTQLTGLYQKEAAE
jgi:putative phage-type endonuclease